MEILVVVADAARARFFRVMDNTGEREGSQHALGGEVLAGALVEVEGLSHPASRMHENMMSSDAPGMSSVLGMRSKFGMEEIMPPKEEEAVRFAKEVAEMLKNNLEEFDLLYLIAAPHFLGLLRHDLDKGVISKIAAEIDKDLSLHSAKDIRAHLPAALPPQTTQRHN